jgi:hypothetical protein
MTIPIMTGKTVSAVPDEVRAKPQQIAAFARREPAVSVVASTVVDEQRGA